MFFDITFSITTANMPFHEEYERPSETFALCFQTVLNTEITFSSVYSFRWYCNWLCGLSLHCNYICIFF